MSKDLTFEEALQKLEDCVRKIKSPECTLEESMALYEESVKYYDLCEKILSEARQKLEIYRPETGTTEEFDVI